MTRDDLRGADRHGAAGHLAVRRARSATTSPTAARTPPRRRSSRRRGRPTSTGSCTRCPTATTRCIDDEGGNLSAGEQQLITIARAFLADPSLLILDEATSSVDTRTELLVQQAMAALRTDRTSFVIAHRLSTIRDADLILVMEDGAIVEQGTHDELLAARGAYSTCTTRSSSPRSRTRPSSPAPLPDLVPARTVGPAAHTPRGKACLRVVHHSTRCRRHLASGAVRVDTGGGRRAPRGLTRLLKDSPPRCTSRVSRRNSGARHEAPAHPRRRNRRHHHREQAAPAAAQGGVEHHRRRPGRQARLPARLPVHTVRDLPAGRGHQVAPQVPRRRHPPGLRRDRPRGRRGEDREPHRRTRARRTTSS